MSARTSAVIGLVLLMACNGWHTVPLPTPVSRPHAATGQFRAGASRVDITPPPGVGLAGSGPEGRRSMGYRTRLFANAMYLEDAGGERIAFVVVDLAHVSPNLHRLAAARLLDSTGIGADRLVIAATHTHSGPAHFYAERQYNDNVARVPGYDPRVADFLVTRIVRAVVTAVRSAAPAAARWDSIRVEHATTNRSLEAHCLNPEDRGTPACGAGRPGEAVDPWLRMLRVDRLPGASDPGRPIGSLSLFAIHGTGIPSPNTLLDGDIHSRVSVLLSRRAGAEAGSVHLFANGALGDVSPDVRRDPACDVPRIGLFDPVPSPRGPGEIVDFLEPPGRLTCVERGVKDVERVAEAIATRAGALYERLGQAMATAGTGGMQGFVIRRAFNSVVLPGIDSLCQAGELGSATAAGAELAESRVRGWRWLVWPLEPIALEEGGRAVQPARAGRARCQAPKRTLLGPIQLDFVVGEHGLPEVGQLTVARIGPVLVGAVPGEVTTTAGHRMRAAMHEAARGQGVSPAGIALVGLANGFLQYITTPEEYGWQAYEGGSTLYGPASAGFFARRLAELTALAVDPSITGSPPTQVGPVSAYPGKPLAIMAAPSPAPPGLETGPITLRCRDGRLSAEWRDLPPGSLLPRETPWVRLSAEGPGAPAETVATDGDGRLELHSIGKVNQRGYLWRAVWLGVPDGRRYRIARLDEAGNPVRVSGEVACGAPSPAP